MNAASAYKSLSQEEKQFLLDTAKDVAMLVTTPERMAYFRQQLGVFAEQWNGYKAADDASRKGRWQAAMGKPGNPLDAIWMRFHGQFCFPSDGGTARILGVYTMLAVIHDRILPKCPPIASGTLPKECAGKIWRDLVSGAHLEGSAPMLDDDDYQPRMVIPRWMIDGFLQDVTGDIENRFAPQDDREQASDKAAALRAEARAEYVGSEDNNQMLRKELFADPFVWQKRENLWQRAVGLHAPTSLKEMIAIWDTLSIPEGVVDLVAEITDMMDDLDAVDNMLINAIKNDRRTAADDDAQSGQGAKQPGEPAGAIEKAATPLVGAMSNDSWARVRELAGSAAIGILNYRLYDEFGERELGLLTTSNIRALILCLRQFGKDASATCLAMEYETFVHARLYRLHGAAIYDNESAEDYYARLQKTDGDESEPDFAEAQSNLVARLHSLELLTSDGPAVVNYAFDAGRPAAKTPKGSPVEPAPTPNPPQPCPIIAETPVTLREFMQCYCVPLPSKALLERRVESLRNAAESHKVDLPVHVTPYKKGQAHKYLPDDLKNAWADLAKHLTDLPALKRP